MAVHWITVTLPSPVTVPPREGLFLSLSPGGATPGLPSSSMSKTEEGEGSAVWGR